MPQFPSPTGDHQRDREALFDFIHNEAQGLGLRVAISQKGVAIMQQCPSIEGFGYALLQYLPPHLPNILLIDESGYVYDIAVADPFNEKPNTFLTYAFFEDGSVDVRTSVMCRGCIFPTWDLGIQALLLRILESLRYLASEVSKCRTLAETRARLYGLQE